MIRSLSRPVTNSSPSSRKPRSPVRRNGPSPRVRGVGAERVARSPPAGSSSRSRRPALHPDLADLVRRAARAGSRDRRSAICSSSSARPQPTSVARLPDSSAAIGSGTPVLLQRVGVDTRGPPAPAPAARPRRSAWPRPGRSTGRTPRARKPHGANASANASRVVGPHRLRAVERHAPAATGPARRAASGGIRRTHRS